MHCDVHIAMALCIVMYTIKMSLCIERSQWTNCHLQACVLFEYNRRLYSQGGLARNDRGFEHSICTCRGHAASKRH